MACGRDAVEIDGLDSSETEALLNEAQSSTQEGRQTAPTESMTTQFKTPWSSHKPAANNPDGGTEIALESSRDSHDLDSAQLRAQGHEAALQRAFSPLAALGLGFR